MPARASRPAQAVETGRIIRPLRIAEIKGAAGQGVCGQWGPGGIDEAGAGFDHDGKVVRGSDVEAEAVGFHAEPGTGGQHLRVPQHGWTTTEDRSPARGPWQVIDRRGVEGVSVTAEHPETRAGGITLEIDAGQAEAV